MTTETKLTEIDEGEIQKSIAVDEDKAFRIWESNPDGYFALALVLNKEEALAAARFIFAQCGIETMEARKERWAAASRDR